MNYTLNQLKIFVKIFETKSVTKTAEALFLTQPAVSIQLKNFQDQFDVSLYEIINKRLFITEFGEEIYNEAKAIIEQGEVIKQKTLAYSGHLTGTIKISIVSTGKYVIPFFLSDFIKKYPGIDLKIDVTNKQSVIKNLEENSVDFSLVSVIPTHLKLNKIELMNNELYLVSNKNVKSKGKELFKKHPVVYREEGSATRHIMETYLNANKIIPIKKYELTSNEAVKQSVLADLGVSIMPLIGIKNEIKNGLMKTIPVKGLPIITKWNIVWLKDKKITPASMALISYINENKSEIINKHFLLKN